MKEFIIFLRSSSILNLIFLGSSQSRLIKSLSLFLFQIFIDCSIFAFTKLRTFSKSSFFFFFFSNKMFLLRRQCTSCSLFYSIPESLKHIASEKLVQLGSFFSIKSVIQLSSFLKLFKVSPSKILFLICVKISSMFRSSTATEISSLVRFLLVLTFSALCY